ncbi:MAG: RecQ family ATP-dependent DNA helicase [Chloroflexia bacterium]
MLVGSEAGALGDDGAPEVPGERQSDPWSEPLIANLTLARENYVVFDLETTGTDPLQDRIIQIAALKVQDGKPVAARSWYVNPGPFDISYTLQVTLGIVDDPEILGLVKSAPPVADILPLFFEFVGDLPLIAFNARFDGRFLSAACGGELPTVSIVDCMELAVLLRPNFPRQRLRDFAEGLGLSPDGLSAEWTALQLDTNIEGHTVSTETLHNAITDVYVTHRVFAALQHILETPGHDQDLVRALLPEAFTREATYTGVDRSTLVKVLNQRQWVMGRVPDGRTIVPAERLLTEYLAGRGQQPRIGQLEMQTLVADALMNDKYAMVEAPTGTGKTLAYLTAAVYHAKASGQPVALSTAYRNLQDQLLAEIDDLRRLGPLPFRSQLLKGVGNYLCYSQIIRYVEDGDPGRKNVEKTLTLAERFVLSYIILWLPGSANGTIDELSHWLLETLPAAHNVVHQLGASAGCNPSLQDACAGCPMPGAYANARQADIIVINHALWLSDPQRLPAFSTLVLDEAHTLEDVATNALTKEVSSTTLTDLLNTLYNPATERGLLIRIRAGTSSPGAIGAAARAIGAVRRAGFLVRDFGSILEEFVRLCSGPLDPRFGASYRLEAPPWRVHPTRWQRADDAHKQLFGLHLKDLLAALSQLYQAVSDAQDLQHQDAVQSDLSDQIMHLDEQCKLAYDLIKVGDQKQVYWIEVRSKAEASTTKTRESFSSWALKAAPIDVGEVLQSFYDRLSSVSLVSATLALRGNDFSYFIERLGLSNRLDSAYIRKLPPALPYGTNAFLGLVDYMTYAPLQHTMESFKEELAGELRLFLQLTGGRALGLFTARERMESVAGQIVSDMAHSGIPLYVQSALTSRRRLLEEFKARNESVLFGLRSFWEGVDAPGETLSFVFMEKLPFPLLIEPVHRARAEYLSRQGKSEFEDYMLPLMLLQFKQGFGRLMRTETDHGAVVLFDKRIHRKEYRADLLSSLPGFVRDLDAEKSRKRFYETLAGLFPDLIDIEAKRGLLNSLPDDIQLKLDAVLARYRLPDVIPHEAYAQWRPTLLAALHEVFGHDQFNMVGDIAAQEDVIRHMLAGEDVLGVMPTGSGKSLAFQLPALLRGGVTLVFSPLIALMKDQVGGLNEKGIEVVGAIYSGQSATDRDDVLDRMRRGKARLVYVSPERLRDPYLLSALRETQVTQVVVDEAHCVYMWGPSFRPDFLYLPRLFDMLGYRPPVVALTATATTQMKEAITTSLNMHNAVRVEAPIDRPELQFVVYNADSKYGRIGSRNDRFRRLLQVMQAADRDCPPILVYVTTVAEAEQLARMLRVAGYDARAYHGRLEPAERTSVQEMFMDGHINVVVCTKAFGMGIDKADIRYVIHYNLPGDLESYFQEAGRAGRDRKPAYCVLLYHQSDIGTQQYFIDNSTPNEETINQVLQNLNSMPGEILYVDPDQLQQQLEVEDVQLRVALHHLESQGYIARSSDFTVSGTLTFQVAPDEVLAMWQGDPVDAELLARLLRSTRWPAYRKLEVNILSVATDLGVGPDAIDRLLMKLSLQGDIIYRPWRRGFVLIKGKKMREGASVPAGALAADEHRAQMKRKLGEMVSYATGNSACRRATIVRYFDQAAAPRCQGCDVCQPERPWPWSLLTSRDVATPDAYVDPAFVILETVKWSLDRAIKYGSPLGTGTLMAIMKGDQYTIARYETDPHMKRWRIQQLRNCPHWGVLSVLPSYSRVLPQYVGRLVAEAYIHPQRQMLGNGESYEYLGLTLKGAEQLTSGRLLQWSM